MTRNRPARYTNIPQYTRTSKLGKVHSVQKHRRRLTRFPRKKKKVKRVRVPRIVKPEVSRAIHELSKDDVEYSGAFDYGRRTSKMENAIFREGETWRSIITPSQARLLYPDIYEEYDRDFEVTWHTHPKGGFPYQPSPRDIVSFYRDSAILGQENHLVYVEETKSVFVIRVTRKRAQNTILNFGKSRPIESMLKTLDKDWNQYNHLPMKERRVARERMMKRWSKKYGFEIREISIDDPIHLKVIPQEPKKIARRF